MMLSVFRHFRHILILFLMLIFLYFHAAFIFAAERQMLLLFAMLTLSDYCAFAFLIYFDA